MKYLYKNLVSILPTIGILIFVGFYLYSATLYPGGSQVNLNSIGYDWVNNYWCDLMNKYGVNGQVNQARIYSITAMIILCMSLTIFFIQFAQTFAQNPFWKFTIKIGGVLAMFFAVLISTKYHDLMASLSSVFGVFVVVGIVWEVYKSKLNLFKIGGVVCIMLLGVNNYIYYSRNGIEYLPLIQKMTFVAILLWIIGLNYKMMKKETLLYATCKPNTKFIE